VFRVEANTGNLSGADDEIAMGPRPLPKWLAARRSRPGRRGWLVGGVAAVLVIGSLKLAGVIWTSPPPKWIAALGKGVTVTGPEQVAPGHESPGAALAGLVTGLSSTDPAAACGYMIAGSVTQCEAQLSRAPRSQLPHFASFRIGYVATSGTHALVGYTGKICSPGDKPECSANNDPAAVFSAGSTFAVLWFERVDSISNSGYQLLPCAEVGGKWYYGPQPGTSVS